VKYAFDALQPVQSVSAAAAPVPPISVPAKTVTPESAAPGA
jgi:hypothetical protein